jgi:hypothetical protein
MVTVQERGCRAYRVSGNKKRPPTFLSAVDSDGVHQAFLEVSVKSLSSYRIAFYSVSDSNLATGKIIHTTHKRRSEDLKQLVDSVYSKTAFHTGRKLRCWLMKRCTTCYSPLGGRLIIITPKRLGDLMYPRGGAFGFERGTRLGRTYSNVINP